MPLGTIQLEWGGGGTEKIDQDSSVLQNEIYKLASSDPSGWLFFLGFSNKKIELSPSLSFWRGFSGLFFRRLSLTPEIEEHRDGVSIPINDEELTQLLAAVPPMSGGEYLNREVLAGLWSTLHGIFAERIAEYDGTVGIYKKL